MTRSGSQSKKTENRTCMEVALAKLSYRMRTESELRKSLIELGYSEDEILSVMEELKSYGYIDDDRYIREFYRSSRRKSWSRNRIIRALSEKGVSRSKASDVIDEFENSEEFEDMGLISDDRAQALELGQDLLRKHINSGKAADDKFWGKVGRRLMTLGYDQGCCYYVIKRLRDTHHSMTQEEEL